MQTSSGCDYDESDCHDEDKSWPMVCFRKKWNEPARGKFIKGVKETLIQPLVTNFFAWWPSGMKKISEWDPNMIWKEDFDH